MFLRLLYFDKIYSKVVLVWTIQIKIVMYAFLDTV